MAKDEWADRDYVLEVVKGDGRFQQSFPAVRPIRDPKQAREA